MSDVVYNCADFFCGAGGMVVGYEQARAEMLGTRARFKTIFAVDVWPVAAESCERMTGVKVHVADLFTADQYVGFHGERPCWCGSRQRLDTCHATPPPEWVELQPTDLRRLCPGGVRVLKGSPPCKSFSRLLGGERALTPRYQALNQLVVRWLWLWLEAFPDAPPDLILMENVPDIADPRRRRRRRGEEVVEQVEAMLASYGYACRRTTFDCGEIAGLAQHRDRFLLVARRVKSTQTPLLEPFTVPMRTIGDVVGDLPPPVGDTGVPMHVLPGNERRTLERLAFVEAGADWRSIERNWLSAPSWMFAGGVLLPTTAEGSAPDPRLDRTAFNNVLRLAGWADVGPCVTGGGGAVGNVADPRVDPDFAFSGVYGVQHFEDAARTVTGGGTPSRGPFSVEDPRLPVEVHGGILGVRPWGESSAAVTGRAQPTTGAYSVEDPRLNAPFFNGGLGVGRMDEQSVAITGETHPNNGRYSVADPRLTCSPNGATLRVVDVDGQSPPVIGTAGVWSSGSPDGVLIAPDWKLWHRTGRWVPRAWHRAFSLRELADLQSVPRRDHVGRPLQLYGTLDQQRMQIGNMVPPAAGRVIAELMLATLLASHLGVPVSGGSGIWVRDGGVLRWHHTSRTDGRDVEWQP